DFLTQPLQFSPDAIANLEKARITLTKNTGIEFPKDLFTQNNIAGKIAQTPFLQTKPLILQNLPAQALPGIIIGQTPEKFPVISLFIPGLNQEQFFTLQIPVQNITLGTQLAIIPQNMHELQKSPGQPLIADILLAPQNPFSFMSAEPWP